jgi:lysophospholipase L1-like esterase
MRTILCYGDSNTYGAKPLSGGVHARYSSDVRWPRVLHQELGPEFEVIEEGLNGRTTIWDDPFEEGRNGRPYLLPCLRSHAPIDLVVLALGVNDLKAVFRLSAPEIASGVATLAGIVMRSGAGPSGRAPRVLLIVPPPIVATPITELWGFGGAIETSRRLATFYERVAQSDGHALLDAGSVITVSQVDGLHFDEEAHRKLGRAVAEAVRKALA